VNLTNGDRTLIEKGLSRTMEMSPDDKWFLYLKGSRVYSYEIASGKSTVIDGGRSFVNTEDDHDFGDDMHLQVCCRNSKRADASSSTITAFKTSVLPRINLLSGCSD
jgi:hypothetical protein